ITSVATYLIQQETGVIKSLASYPLNVRIANVLVSYVNYIGKMFWPYPLAMLYPHPGALPVWQSAGAFLLLISISFLVLSAAIRYPYFLVGWLWYLGTLVPVIGLVVVGPYAMADRYTYVPLIGLFIIIAWGAPELLSRWRYKSLGLATMATVILFALMVTTWLQIQHWKNSITLFEHTIDITENNYVIHNNLGIALAKEGRTNEANKQYLTALRIKPDFVAAHLNLGNSQMDMGRIDEAKDHFYEALKIYPDFEGIHYSLGLALFRQGRTAEAIRHYSRALQLEPNDADVHNNIGLALINQGRIRAAIYHFEKALKINPDHKDAYKNLNNVLNVQKKAINKAISKIQAALKLNSKNPVLHYYMGNLYQDKGELDKAIDHYKKALSIEPELPDVLNNLAMVYAIRGEYDKARILFKKAIAVEPDQWEAYYYIAGTYARQNRIAESIKWLKEACHKGFNNWDLLRTDNNLKNIKASSYYKELIKNR
ncbi:tetratricopeptide repeat protein, partial [Thermodesulfobacteriota bacterium]